MSAFDKILEMKKTYEDTLKAEGQELLKQHFAAFFEAHPAVQAIRWTQYTPYFNDGDACTFGVHDFCYKEGGPTVFDGKDDDDDWEDGYGQTSSTRAAVRELLESVPEDVMLAIFGDHVQITATRAGFDVAEYEHN